MNKGDFVRIDYIGKLESGEIFDLTVGSIAKKENIYSPKIEYKPMPVIVGAGMVIKGLDSALETMNIGDKKTVEITPEDGFGQRDAKFVKVFPKKNFKDLQPGMIVEMQGIRGRIQSVDAGRVRIDFNNPMAGKKLIYDVEIKEIIENSEDQIKAAFEFFGIKNVDVKLDGQIVEVTGKIHDAIKERASKIITENLKIDGKPIEKIRFVQEFSK